MRLFVSAALFWVTAHAVLMPSPEGPFGVGFREYIQPKITRPDFMSPTGKGTFLLVSVYYPTATKMPAHPQPYFDMKSSEIWGKALDIPATSLQSLQTLLQPNASFLDLNSSHSESIANPQASTLIFSPGEGVNCYMYYLYLASLASYGYTIIAIDHPGEPPALQLPNGTTVIGLDINYNVTDAIAQEIYNIRVSDMEAVAADLPRYAKSVSAPFSTSRYIGFGHSIGGAAAAGGAQNVKSMLGGLNYDGSFWNPFENVKKPLLMMESINHTAPSDPSLPNFFNVQTAWWEAVSVYGSGHGDYSDLTAWASVLGISDDNGAREQALNQGAIGWKRMQEIVLEYTKTFFCWLDGSGSDALFHSPSLKWHEVCYVNGSFFPNQ